jgi:ATP-binding cassette subfamily B protein
MFSTGGGGGGGGGGQFGVFSTRSEESRKRTTPDRKLIARLFKYAEDHRRNLIIGVVSIAISSITTLCIPYLHKVAIDQVITPNNISGFIWWIPIFVSVILVHYLAQYTQVFQMRILGENVVAKMREEMMSKLQIISLRYFSEGETGRIMSRPINDANMVRMFLRQGLTTIILDVCSLCGSLTIIFFLDSRLATIAVSILPVAAILAWLMGKLSRKAHRIALTFNSGLISRMQENLSGIKVIKAFVEEKKAAKEFEESSDQVAKANIRTVVISSSYQPVVFFMRVIGTALVLWYGAMMVGTGEITVGTLIAFTEYQFQYFRPLVELVTAYDQYQSAMAATERMFDLIDTGVEVEDVSPDKAVKIETIDDVEFRNVIFGYDKNVPVIRNISFAIGSNKKMAIVGPTGAGKSTIINLLSRFYDPLDGEIFVNGSNVKDIPIASLREHMSIVLQDSFLFPMSVKDNIRFGKPEATDEEVIEAAKAVGAHEFIMRLPKGYEYIIQEGSSNISIGQRQLISFARTLLMNPRLLILDEATSSIDPYTELVIQTALKNLLENRMAIIIAHRLSTIRLCDEIIVIDRGEIVEKGTHSELMNKGGLYSSFYRMQFREEAGVTADVAIASP